MRDDELAHQDTHGTAAKPREELHNVAKNIGDCKGQSAGRACVAMSLRCAVSANHKLEAQLARNLYVLPTRGPGVQPEGGVKPRGPLV